MSIKVFQEFYSKLAKTLPMKDAIFTAELYSRDLFPDDLKEQVESLFTSATKASYFLDHVIKPSVTSGNGSCFDELLNVMNDCDYQNVIELSKQIKDCLKETSDSGECPSD